MQPREELRIKVKNLPDKPGIYQYLDESGQIIYIGKAKSLKKRVNSYFVGYQRLSRKTQNLVRSIYDLRIIIVNTEFDALLLENTLIKKHQPRYNVMLKDDKSYPSIVVKKESFPRVFETRQIIRDGSEYFGPFVSGKMMVSLMDLIKNQFPLRNCNLNLSPKLIAKKKYKVCLEYHIGNCLGPCEGFQTETSYEDNIQQIKKMLRGDLNSLIKDLTEKMKDLSKELKFEEAHEYKLRIQQFENYQSKSVVVSTSITHVDVFSILTDNEYAYVNYLRVTNGSIVLGYTLELKKRLEEDERDLMLMGIAELRSRFNSLNTEIIVPFKLEVDSKELKFIVPQRGDKKKLLDMSLRNAEYYKRERQKQFDLVDPERHVKRVYAQMVKDLRLQNEPRHIECFDNSNFHGTNAVSALTVFKNLKPSKKDYRHYNVQTVKGPDDFATMREVVLRRYKRLLEEGTGLPDLVVIDGGKGQLSAAVESLTELGIYGKIPVLGIAKKLEEIYFPGDSLPLYLDKKSETLKVIQQIRDEAHRFGITHHRGKRSKSLIKTELTSIPGIGDKKASDILSHFGSVQRIKESKLEELQQVCGNSDGLKIYTYFKVKLTE